MSSTNRGNQDNRHVSDYYRTPIADIQTFIKHWPYAKREGNIVILDPCAGGDAINTMSYPVALQGNNIADATTIKTMDIRDDSPAEIITDYLQTDVVAKLGQKPDLIITNPPFCFAQEIVQKAIDDISDDGWVVMLLRLNFFGSKKRFAFFQDHAPEYCFVHSKRMCFTNDGASDSIEYAHFIWRKTGRRFTLTKVI